MASRPLVLHRPDSCSRWGAGVAAGSTAFWDSDARTVTCLGCHEQDSGQAGLQTVDTGVAGASAAGEYERRKSTREARVRTRHPRVGGLVLALSDEPQHQLAFRRGAAGERAVGDALERRTAAGDTVVLHDRRMPGGRGNIDHLAIARSGVYVIDAKDWKGKVSVRRPLLGEPRLMIERRDCTRLIDGLDRQVAAVRAARGGAAWPLLGVLCFTNADLPLLGTTRMRSHLLLYRKALAKRLNAGGRLSSEEVQAVAAELAVAFPPA